jgi:hypothetical protein
MSQIKMYNCDTSPICAVMELGGLMVKQGFSTKVPLKIPSHLPHIIIVNSRPEWVPEGRLMHMCGSVLWG